ncbi:hypothetical protein C0583_06500 [Candidatus Parcubacteria bacterium]|nr:MAG: hypothetical protein C0583_06500 [Candidatus Parcubacteria bacterium]
MGLIKTFKRFKIFITILIIFLFVLFLLSQGIVYDKSELEYGVTFSHKQAIDLGLDWKKVYLNLFDDLGVKKIRLSSYWDEVEKNNNLYKWDYLDWQITEAEKRNVEVILAVGGRLPRWPECHFPDWAKILGEEERHKELLDYIEKTINRYKDREVIKYWQLENEPFLPNFGECPTLNADFLDQELSLVKSLDSRDVLMTDSGELSLWVPAAQRADIFGTTMYRDTYSEALNSYIHYPIEPGFFQFKRRIAKLFSNPKKWIVIELQAEPWGPVPFQELDADERARTMDHEKFVEILEFARKTGFREFYLWGVEWWYWEKETNDNDLIWEEAKLLFN